MNRLITTTLAVTLSTLMFPAFALQGDLPVGTSAPDAASQLLQQEIQRLGQEQTPWHPMTQDATLPEAPASERSGELLVSRKDKVRKHSYVAPPKGKRHRRPRRGGHHDYRDGYHYDYHHHPKPNHWHDRYFDGLGLNLIFHLDG